MACGCLLGAAPVPADDLSDERAFEAQLATLAREDPDSPALLEARLERVDTLLRSGDGCQGRLAAAQDALKDAGRSPALPVLVPLGTARLASLEYELHHARARCAAGRASAGPELHAALTAAQRGVDLYREGLDYSSMAIMQFNVAATQRALGDLDAAVASLATAVHMDEEYGLADDALENQQLLSQWRTPAAASAPDRAPAAPATVPAKPPQKRITALRFAWSASDSDEKIELTSTAVVQGHTGQVTATRTMLRSVHPYGRTPDLRGTPLGWRVSYQVAEPAKGEAIGFTAGEQLFGLAVP